MKIIITIIMIIFSIGMIHSYDFELSTDNSRAESSTCELSYDNLHKNLSFEKEHTNKIIKKEINSNLSLVCSSPIYIIRFKLYDDNRDLIYSEQVINKNSYSYNLDIKKIKLNLARDNICNIRTGLHTEEYKLKKNEHLNLEFINLFSISCDSSLENSTLRLYDKSNYNIKYKVFEENEKSFTIDLDDPIINYNNKVELYLKLYDNDDNFKCKTSNNEKTIELKNPDKKLIISKEFYMDNNFKLDCDYKFKQIQLFVQDSLLEKDLNSLNFYNVSNLNIALDMIQNKKMETKTTKPKVENITEESIDILIKDDLSGLKNFSVSVKIHEVINKTPVGQVNKRKIFTGNNKTPIDITKMYMVEPVKEEEKVGFFRSIWNWLFN